MNGYAVIGQNNVNVLRNSPLAKYMSAVEALYVIKHCKHLPFSPGRSRAVPVLIVLINRLFVIRNIIHP